MSIEYTEEHSEDLTETIEAPDYLELSDALSQAKGLISAAEVHGMVCGIVCAGKRLTSAEYLPAILESIDPNNRHADVQAIVENLFQLTLIQLDGLNFDFDLILPDDETPLNARAESVGNWCLGLMTGLGLAGIKMEDCRSEDTHIALEHINEIAKIDYVSLEFSEEDEQAYEEVVEYLRVVVMMLYTEFNLEDGDGDAGGVAKAPTNIIFDDGSMLH